MNDRSPANRRDQQPEERPETNKHADNEHEAEGVGKQLLEFAEGYAIAEGATTLQVVVSGADRRATAFYRGRGFVVAGEDLLELVLPRR